MAKLLPNANTIKVECEDDIAKTITLGEHNRSVGATKANEHSSRSHCLLMISIVGEEIESGAKMNGKLVLVDLAGSERVGKLQPVEIAFVKQKHKQVVISFGQRN